MAQECAAELVVDWRQQQGQRWMQNNAEDCETETDRRECYLLSLSDYQWMPQISTVL